VNDDGTYTDTSPFVVDYAGNVGIGTTSPAKALHVKISTDGAPVRFEDSSGYCEMNPITTTWTCTSDARLKKDIQSLSSFDNLTRINQIRPVSFKWRKQSDDTIRFGLIAQEVEQVFPEFVSTDENGLKVVMYGAFTVTLISAMQAQQNQIDSISAMADDFSGSLDVQNKEMQQLSEALSSLTIDSQNKEVAIQQKISSLRDNLNFGGSQINSLGAKMNLVDERLSQNIQEKTEVSFYKFAEVSDQLFSTISNQVVEDSQFSGAYDNPENFQEVRVNLSGANQIDLSEKEIKESYLVYDVFIEDPSAFLDFNTELGNQVDQRELQWNSSAHPFFLPGWNQVKLSLNSGIKTGSIDWQNLNYFRAYFKFKTNNNLKFKDIHIETKAVYRPLAQIVDAKELDLWNNADQGTAIKDIFVKLEIQKETNFQVTKLSQELVAMQDQLSLLQEQTKAVIDFSLAMNLDKVVYRDASGSVLGLSVIQAEEVEAKKVKAEDYVVSENSDPLKNNVGSVIVRIGEQEVLIKNAGVTIDSKIIVTPVGSSPVFWVISEKMNGIGFKIKLDKPAEFDIAFDYWVIGVEK
jgi:hypothetical protein